MNTLVALGASAAFGVSCAAAGLTGLGWRTFFEEPAMLLGFVLVGRTLEERAKLQASSDLVALQARAFQAAAKGEARLSHISGPCSFPDVTYDGLLHRHVNWAMSPVALCQKLTLCLTEEGRRCNSLP